MMGSMLGEARARGFALSTLYPANVSLYRRAGYERAGGFFTISFDPRTLEVARGVRARRGLHHLVRPADARGGARARRHDALSMRGGPRCARGTVVSEVSDASLPENAGRYTVSLEDGRAVIAASSGDGGVAPRVAISERGLAALHTGHASAHALAQAGWLEANEETCALLDEWFAGPYPTARLLLSRARAPPPQRRPGGVHRRLGRRSPRRAWRAAA
jgi:predicted acetyltransferase